MLKFLHSLTLFFYQYKRTNYGTVQSLVQQGVRDTQASLEAGTLGLNETMVDLQGMLPSAFQGLLGKEQLPAILSLALDLAQGALTSSAQMVDKELAVFRGEMEDWLIANLVWWKDLASNKTDWNILMGLNWENNDYFYTEGVFCLSDYFYEMYVLEWYYDYIGYDYYHEDYSFYYDDYEYVYYDYSGSGSGSGSGDYYEDYSGSASGSGDSFLDYDYYEDHYADWEDVIHYHLWFSSALRKIILADSAEEVFLFIGNAMLDVVKALPLEETLALLDTLLESLKWSLEAGSMEKVAKLVEGVMDLQEGVMAGTEQELVQGLATRLQGQEVWEEAEVVMHRIEQEMYAEVLRLGRELGIIPEECEVDLGRGAVPLICTTSTILWEVLYELWGLEEDYEVGMFKVARYKRRAKKKLKKLGGWLDGQKDGLYCLVGEALGRMGREGLDLVLGEQLEQGSVGEVMAVAGDLGNQLFQQQWCHLAVSDAAANMV